MRFVILAKIQRYQVGGICSFSPPPISPSSAPPIILDLIYIVYSLYTSEIAKKNGGDWSRNGAISVLTVWHSERAAQCRGAGRRWETTKYRAWLIAALPIGAGSAGNAGTRHLPPAGDLKARNRDQLCIVDNLI